MLLNNASGVAPRVARDDALRARILGEYFEMPGLSLTLPQAARLFNADQAHCARMLKTLVAEGTLRVAGREFVLRGSQRWP